MSGFRAKFKLQIGDSAWRKLRKTMKDLNAGRGSYIKAGVLGRKAEEEHDLDPTSAPMTNARLAIIHEFGAPEVGIPARPFVFASFRAHKQEYLQLLGQLIGRALSDSVWGGKLTIARAMGLVGAKMASDMRSYVVSRLVQPQLDPASRYYQKKLSMGRKGTAGTPAALIDTGRMIGAITWQVVAGSDEEEEVK